MNRAGAYIDSLTENLTTRFLNPKASALFVKGVFVFVLFRLIGLWLVSDMFLHDATASFPRSLIGKVVLWPTMFAHANPLLFFLVTLAVILAGLILRPNYLVNALLFWIVLSLYKIRYPATNGSDVVLITISLLMIPLAFWPSSRNTYVTTLRTTLYNTFRILLQIQVLSIYLISGWDKLTSEVWRSGVAFDYIAHIDMMFNPVFTPMLEHSFIQLLMAWLTILFELLFIPMVCFRQTRLPILIIGVAFHIVIWLMLGLPDFAWMMIATYPIFLKDTDLVIIQNQWNRIRGVKAML